MWWQPWWYPPLSSTWILTLVIGIVSTTVASGLRLPLQRRDNGLLPRPSQTRLNYTNKADPFQFGIVNTNGDARSLYFVTISVDGKDFAVQFDTGSSDLWLDTAHITFTDEVENTHKTGTIKYGDGSVATGDILLGMVKFGNFIIPKQAFISAPGTNATADGDQGILGVAPPQLSFVNETLADTPYNGNSLLLNLYSIYPHERNFMTLTLNRSDIGISGGGLFTIGEINPAYEAIKAMPMLPVLESSRRWLVPMDGILVNGKKFTMHGKYNNYTGPLLPPEFKKDKLFSLLDSGTSLSSAPQYYVDAIYSDLPGAMPVSGSHGLYQLPCDTKVNVSMMLGGVEYPMNPLDIMIPATDDDGVSVVCRNTITRTGTGSMSDWVLGAAFLRNVYTLFDLGTYNRPGDKPPNVQMLSITDREKAWANFDVANAVRIEDYKTNVIHSPFSSLLPSPSSGHLADDDKSDLAEGRGRGSCWIAVSLVMAAPAVLLIVTAVKFVRRRRKEETYVLLPMTDSAEASASVGVDRSSNSSPRL